MPATLFVWGVLLSLAVARPAEEARQAAPLLSSDIGSGICRWRHRCLRSAASLGRRDYPLENPHKGWYHHFPDNHPDKYRIANDRDLLDFPGMDHLYIRLAWSYLEPREGEFRWEVIDQLIDKWVANGMGISFRISCKETSTDRIEQQYATPKWVMEAGQGGYFRKGQASGSEGPWEPGFDDPIFLRKLENFLMALPRVTTESLGCVTSISEVSAIGAKDIPIR